MRAKIRRDGLVKRAKRRQGVGPGALLSTAGRATPTKIGSCLGSARRASVTSATGTSRR